jgi:uncharacterized protein (TIGR00299 family) protein
MSKILKIEAFAGMSGDMFLGALAGLADAHEELKRLPEILHLANEAEILVSEVEKSSISCKHVKVVDKLSDERKKREHNHNHDHPHDHDHDHSHAHHRHLKDVYKIIDGGDLNDQTRKIAKEIFLKLAEAEAEVHGMDVNEIHFHEVGAIDSIIDIIGSAWLLDQLQIESTYCTAVTTGSGFVQTAHGKLPVPAPATKLLLHGIPTVAGDEKGEMCTPTGAAILKYLSPSFDIPALIERKTAYGPGEKDFEIPNTLRLSICEVAERKDDIFLIQTNIDDMSGEFLGIEFQEKLLENGAIDYYFEQVIMKKGRPGVVLNALARQGDVKKVSELILEQTSTIGVRFFPVQRIELERSQKEVATKSGNIRSKEVITPRKGKRVKPESSEIINIAYRQDKSPLEIYYQFIKSYDYEKDE